MIPAGWEPILSRVTPRTPEGLHGDAYPFSVPAVSSMSEIDLSQPITYFVGENGSGKSTLLEGIAVATEVPTAGSQQSVADTTLASARNLADKLRLVWKKRSRQGLYMRAEDFFGYQRQMARDDARIAREKAEFLGGRPKFADEDASAHPDEAEAQSFLKTYDSKSHGEAFLELFLQRVSRKGLFVLDEPEGPLSPKRQLALLALLARAIKNGAQFIIATHSPILLSMPSAAIYSFDTTPMSKVNRDELEHVTFTRDFLVAPERYLKHLFDEEPKDAAR